MTIIAWFETGWLIDMLYNELRTKVYDYLKNYHNYSVVGLDKIQNNKNYMFVCNHSLATYDFFLLAQSIFLEKKISTKMVVDNLLYHNPIFNKILQPLGIASVNYRTLSRILKGGETILIAPGGMQEALRSSEEKNVLMWENRRGFIALSITTQTPIILAACPQSDMVYEVYKNPLTTFFYEKFKFPLPFAKGRSALFPFMPKKVELTHYLAGPFVPPTYTDNRDLDKKVDEFHAFILAKMEKLLGSS